MTAVQPQWYEMDSAAVDTHLVHVIAPYKATLDSSMNEVLGQCNTDLLKELPESTLGDWMTDALVEETQRQTGKHIDFAVQNYGGIRLGELPKGPVTLGKIYELMPFDNTVVILDATGAQLQTFLDHMASRGGWPASSGLRYRISNGKATEVSISGAPLDLQHVYSFIVPDYVANGGDDCSFLENWPHLSLDLLIRDALISNVRHLQAEGLGITQAKDGRIQ